MRRYGAKPWRMYVGDYLAGVRVYPEHVVLSRGCGRTVGSELSQAMVATGQVLFEESVAGDLIGDLSQWRC
jgi:hypothetical protein